MQDEDYKRCSKCGEEKPVGEFCRNRREGDGRQAWCKTCQAADNLRRYHADPAPHRARNKRWLKANRERKSESRKRWEEENPGRALAGRERYKQRHPAKARAGQAVRNAVHRGTLVKPNRCEDCSEPTKPRELHGHHADYGKPLDVEWLCRGCHNKRHNED